jgi:hypothetical protein
MTEALSLSLSFRKKEPTVCPVCKAEHHEEVLRQGGGRLIAGKLTDELRRLYKKGEKFGMVYPQAYSLLVCPNCLYTATPKEWSILKPEEIERIRATAEARKKSIQKILGPIHETDFHQDRTLALGAGSYLLAVDCYNFRGDYVAPTFKKGLYALRGAWLFGDMAELYPNIPYKNVQKFFYQKAYENYSRVLELFQTGKEMVENAGRIGPDTDKDWGYEGLQFTVASLVLKKGIEETDYAKKMEVFQKTKRYLSRLFGSGKSNKSKPSDLIEKTRDLYDKINEMIAKWEEENKPTEPQAPNNGV